jgi:hypothetical protein
MSPSPYPDLGIHSKKLSGGETRHIRTSTLRSIEVDEDCLYPVLASLSIGVTITKSWVRPRDEAVE